MATKKQDIVKFVNHAWAVTCEGTQRGFIGAADQGPSLVCTFVTQKEAKSFAKEKGGPTATVVRVTITITEIPKK